MYAFEKESMLMYTHERSLTVHEYVDLCTFRPANVLHIFKSKIMTVIICLCRLTNLPLTGCTNAQLVSALNNEDQGTLNLGYGLQNLPEDLVNAGMGYQNVSTSDTLANIWPIGTGSNYGPKECLAKCAALNATGAQQPAYGPPSPSSLSQSGAADVHGAGSSETTDPYLYNLENSPDGI